MAFPMDTRKSRLTEPELKLGETNRSSLISFLSFRLKIQTGWDAHVGYNSLFKLFKALKFYPSSNDIKCSNIFLTKDRDIRLVLSHIAHSAVSTSLMHRRRPIGHLRHEILICKDKTQALYSKHHEDENFSEEKC
ncbi:hypothetical protein P8452_74734 [Trifolium repens]|nr:hypothetical protein P8452_74734 [Trifolium repens]